MGRMLAAAFRLRAVSGLQSAHVTQQLLSHWTARMQVAYVPEGLEAIIFTADGDMRQALNNLQVPRVPPHSARGAKASAVP